MLKGLKGILEKGLQIAAPFIGSAFGGPVGSALGSGIASLLTGNKPKDALISAAMGYGGGKMGLFGEKGQNPLANLLSPQKQFTNVLDRGGRDPVTSTKSQPGILQQILGGLTKERGTAEDPRPSYLMQGLASLGPGVLAYMAAKEDMEKSNVPDASEYMSSVDTMYGGQTARPGAERRIRNLNVNVDPTTGAAVYRAGGGIMDISEMEEVTYPVTGFSRGGFTRKTGSINGPGTKTSDSIPAYLSDGEFVQKTDAVNGAGIMMGATNAEEARKKGADFMYALQNKLSRVGKNVA